MTFTNIKDATSEELKYIANKQKYEAARVCERMVFHLELLKGDFAGFPIDRYDHCLQTATRAYRDGMDSEYIVCALFHDIGDILAPYNHAEFAAKLLQPYISERNYFMLKCHGVFQGYYFWDKIGLDKNARNKYKDNPYFSYIDDFCRKYDSPSFDKNYDNMKIDDFIPMIKELVSNPAPNVYSKIFSHV